MLKQVKFWTLSAALAVSGAAFASSPAMAGDIGMMILAKDQRADALATEAKATRKIFNAIGAYLNDQGLTVYDRGDLTKAARVRAENPMGDKKLARFVRNNLRPRHDDADVVMTLNIEADTVRNRGERYVELRAVGRVVDVDTGARLQKIVIDDAIRPVRLKKDCRHKACIHKSLVKRADRIGRDIAMALGDDRQLKRKIRKAARDDDFRWDRGQDVRFGKKAGPVEFSISLVGFDRQTMIEIMDLLPDTDRGYIDHDTRRRSETSRRVDYVTASSRGDIRDHLVSMFVSLGIDARIANADKGLVVSEIDAYDVSWLDDDADHDWGHHYRDLSDW